MDTARNERTITIAEVRTQKRSVVPGSGNEHLRAARIAGNEEGRMSERRAKRAGSKATTLDSTSREIGGRSSFYREIIGCASLLYVALLIPARGAVVVDEGILAEHVRVSYRLDAIKLRNMESNVFSEQFNSAIN